MRVTLLRLKTSLRIVGLELSVNRNVSGIKEKKIGVRIVFSYDVMKCFVRYVVNPVTIPV